MTDHFNIVLYPRESYLIRQITEMAEANCGGRGDEYLLGAGALPHVTLCQFQYPAVKIATVWEKLRFDLKSRFEKPVAVQFAHLFVRPGLSDLHAGKIWVGLSVVPSAELIELQKSVHTSLLSIDILSPTLPLKYFPHLTFGRLPGDAKIVLDQMPETQFWQMSYEFELVLGRSNKYGVLSEKLY